MTRALFLAPLLLATSLTAQVPTRPPEPPTPSPAPAPRPVPAPLPRVSPWVDVSPDINFDLDTRLNLDLASLQNYSYAFDNLNYTLDNLNYSLSSLDGSFAMSGWNQGGPVAWAQQDPADSLYRQARDRFNRGDYRRAAELFKSLPLKFANSVYIADAEYYQAFSLYRIGGTPELKEALAVLEARKPAASDSTRSGDRRYPGRGASSGVRGSASTQAAAAERYAAIAAARTSYSVRLGYGRDTDAAGLAARIANVLSSRGLANDPAVKRALATTGPSCDQEDQSVRAEALSALMQNDPETGRQMAVKILANKDECSVPLRRNAVMLVGNKHDDAAVATLIPVAKSDPSPGVRVAALDYLSRAQTDAAVTAVIEVARASDDKQVQRAAVRALAQSTNARARAEVRAIAESNTVDEALRTSVIDGMDRDRMTAEDGAWLRALYARTTSARLKDRIVSAIARAGGEANNQWLLALLRNEDESLEARTTALEHVGRTMDLATLDQMYDAASQRPIRRAVISLLSERQEPEALDKIVDVAKSGTDVEMRRYAINVLSRSKDPRASKLLLELVDH